MMYIHCLQELSSNASNSSVNMVNFQEVDPRNSGRVPSLLSESSPGQLIGLLESHLVHTYTLSNYVYHLLLLIIIRNYWYNDVSEKARSLTAVKFELCKTSLYRCPGIPYGQH